MAGKHLAPATELTRAMEAAADDWAAVFVGEGYLWRPRSATADIPVVVVGLRMEFPLNAHGKARVRTIARVPSLNDATVEVRPGRLKEVRTDA